MKPSKQVKTYIQAIRTFLEKRYGEVSDEWELQLNLLQDNLIIKEKVDAEIENNIMVADRYGFMVKNPLIKTSIELQTKIQACIEQLGCSPKSLGHLKETDSNDQAEILKNLMN